MAAEAGIAYCSVAMVTDYDCWRESEEAVSVESVMAVLGQNIKNVKKLFVHVIENMKNHQWGDLVEKNKVNRSVIYCFNKLYKFFCFTEKGSELCNGLIN